MSPIQQQRLVGAGLLVLLVAILAYVVLSKVGQHQSEQTLELPEPIEFSSVIEPLDEDSTVIETVEDDSETMVDADVTQTNETADTVIANNNAVESTPVEKTTETTVSAPPTTQPIAKDETAAPEASAVNTDNPTVVAAPNDSPVTGDKWLIQLGSFSIQKNAQSLKSELEKLGYQPYIENSQTDQGTVYRVRLPATANRAQADDTAAKIQKQLGIKAQVITQ
jgi:DedD protein